MLTRLEGIFAETRFLVSGKEIAKKLIQEDFDTIDLLKSLTVPVVVAIFNPQVSFGVATKIVQILQQLE